MLPIGDRDTVSRPEHRCVAPEFASQPLIRVTSRG